MPHILYYIQERKSLNKKGSVRIAYTYSFVAGLHDWVWSDMKHAILKTGLVSHSIPSCEHPTELVMVSLPTLTFLVNFLLSRFFHFLVSIYSMAGIILWRINKWLWKDVHAMALHIGMQCMYRFALPYWNPCMSMHVQL